MINILHIEDNPADSMLVARHLQRQGMEVNVVRVDAPDGLNKALGNHHWDAVLADYSVPGMVCRETLALVSRLLPDCPLILVSGSVGEEMAVELMKEGLWDFVLKDNLTRLCPAIERGFRDSARRRAQRDAEDKLRQAATVFESTQEGVSITDLDSRIVAVNKAFSEISGYSEAEALGQKANIHRSGRHTAEFYQSMMASLSEIGQWRGEIWNRRKNGEIYPAWLAISVVRDDHGTPTHYVSVFSDISRIKRSEEQLTHLAHYDPLTDLPNRLLLQSRLEHAIHRAERHGKKAGVLFVDLDRFKNINDSLGHIVGDQVLVAVAERLKHRVRQEDTLGRFGGDEFLVLVEPIESPEEAALVGRDLLAALQKPFQLVGGNEAFAVASIGISIFPDDGAVAAVLMRNAETAMYKAKEVGRNQFCFYTADMNAEAVAQLEVEAALRRAIEREEFVLFYQPKVNLRTGTIIGAEGLIRWQREGKQVVSPGSFVSLAEKTGLIVPIGTWVIEAACRQLKAWRESGWTELRLAINVSGRQFNSGDLPEIVAKTLERYGVPPESLEMEVTESMLMENPERTVATLEQLKAIGVKLSLDDFGTGYSSFAYLSRFPIDSLKIDQSFVRDVVTEPEAAMIADSIIELAHRMRLKVIAEGVETAAQLGYLRLRNCDEAQGYLMARPMPEEEFRALISSGKNVLQRDAGMGAGTQNFPERRPRTILLVDDERNILSSLHRLLRLDGYRILTAGSGEEGLEALAQNEIDVILSDQRMPSMTGVEFLRRVKSIHPQTVRMVLSGYTELQSITDAINEGAIYKFLTKPWDDNLLRANVEEAFRYKELADENRKLQLELQTANVELARDNAKLREMLAMTNAAQGGAGNAGA